MKRVIALVLSVCFCRTIVFGKTEGMITHKKGIKEAIASSWDEYSNQRALNGVLGEYNIITEEDVNKGTYISYVDVFKAIAKATGCESRDYYLRDWYETDDLAELDYLDDDAKMVLMALWNSHGVIDYKDLFELKPYENVTNYKALLYILRMVGDTYGCTESTIENVDTEKSAVYETAYKKGLILDSNTENADKPIQRKEFYDILERALFVEYYRGGAGGVNKFRLIDGLEYKQNQVKEEKPKKEKEKIEIPINPTVKNDLSVAWDIPQEFDFIEKLNYRMRYDLILEDGTINEKWTKSGTYTSLSGEEILKMLVEDIKSKWVTIRCTYYRAEMDKEYYFYIDVSNIDFVVEGNMIIPGKYIIAKNKGMVKKITLGGGQQFFKGNYYILKSYEKKYRKPEYNYISYEVFEVKLSDNAFICPTNRSFGVSDLDEIHIQKAKVTGDEKTGFRVLITPESEQIFKVNYTN